ncbi:hypothetical protein JCM8547_000813 [Rhodosporidiobolus lusitaniae]
MLTAKRKAASTASKGKGKAQLNAVRPAKRPRVAPPPKASNRPRYDAQSSSGSESDSASEDDEDEDERRRKMLAALEAHQAALLGDVMPAASTSKSVGQDLGMPSGKEQKSVWDLGMDDLEDEEDEDDDDEEDEDPDQKETAALPVSRAPAAQVVAFVEPGRDAPLVGVSDAPLNKKDLRDFKNGKIKNLHTKASVADAVNVKYVGGKAKAKAAALAQGKPVASETPEQAAADAAEESHLDKLDSHLSALIKPLTNPSSPASLPDLLRDLPIAPTKALKGHTPLPKNAPRTLRRGQNAANLKRAQLRDEAAGNAVGSKKGSLGMGREALSLKEKRKLDGTDKRQRGLKGAVGKWGRGQVSLSKQDIRKVTGHSGDK